MQGLTETHAHVSRTQFKIYKTCFPLVARKIESDRILFSLAHKRKEGREEGGGAESIYDLEIV